MMLSTEEYINLMRQKKVNKVISFVMSLSFLVGCGTTPNSNQNINNLPAIETPSFYDNKFDETKVWNLPVVDEEHRFVGFISRSGLFNSYRKTLVDLTSE